MAAGHTRHPTLSRTQPTQQPSGERLLWPPHCVVDRITDVRMHSVAASPHLTHACCWFETSCCAETSCFRGPASVLLDLRLALACCLAAQTAQRACRRMLEWPRLCQHVAAFASTTLGRAAVSQLQVGWVDGFSLHRSAPAILSPTIT